MRVLPLIFTAFVVAGCVAKNPATGGMQLSFVSEEEEYRIGAEAIGGAIRQYNGLYTEKPELNRYMEDRLQDVVRVSERPDKPFTMKLVDDPLVNAFALPGFVTFSRGILPYFNSEAEMMQVMGHEVGHITARHTAQSQTKMVLVNVLYQGAQIAVAQGGGSQQAVDATARLGGVAATFGMQAYSRSAEREADRLGLRYLARLGYDVTSAAKSFDMLHEKSLFDKKYYALAGRDVDEGLLGHLLSSHPDPDERAELMRGLEVEILSSGEKINKIEYLSKIKGLAYGGATDVDGVYGKDSFYHSKYQFTYSLPKGWYFFNGRSGLPDAGHVGSGSSLFVSALENKDNHSAEEAMLYLFPQAHDVRRIAHPDADIFSGQLVGNFAKGSWTERQYGRVAVVKPKGTMSDTAVKNHVLVFHFNATEDEMNRMDGDFLQLVKSYKWLNKTQAQKLEPLRLTLYAVKKGDTVDKLARKMPRRILFEEEFRLLNGLFNGTEVREGQLVKLVEDPNAGKF